MERLPREKTPETLAQIFFALLDESPKNPADIDICDTYRHLFSIMTEKELQDNMEFLYDCHTGELGKEFNKEEREWYKENWFYTFHKSLRQTDFYQGAQMVVPDPLTTEADEKERRDILDKMDEVRRSIPEDHSLTTSEQLAVWRKAQNEKYPEGWKRLAELNTLRQHVKKYTISGHIAMILWGVIHLDRNSYLQMTMERAFNEYGLAKKYQQTK